MSSTAEHLGFLLHPLRGARLVDDRIREGRFQRSLALVTAGTSAVSELEVAYEHYRGSYSNPIMYTPVILSGVLTSAGLAAFFSNGIGRGFLRWTSIITLADAAIGFYFHVRGIARKPGGWRLPMTNMIMGPPVFAPVLFGTSAYLGLVASYLRREHPRPYLIRRRHRESLWMGLLPRRTARDFISYAQDMREGRFQSQVALVTGVGALLSGFEAYYSHYKNNFRYAAQWTPVLLAPALAGAAFWSMRSRRIATTLLPAVALLACADAAVGFFYHARGVLRRPGGRRHLLYNVMYGPPIFAPLLFGAAGTLGLLASLLRRRRP